MADINASGIIIKNKKGEILVLHRKEFVPEGNKWGLPGGGVRAGLTPLETAIFKTSQEVKLEFGKANVKHLGEFKFVDGEGNDVTYNAWVAEFQGEDPASVDLNTEAHAEFKWEKPEVLIEEEDLMLGMYPILKKYLQVNK